MYFFIIRLTGAKTYYPSLKPNDAMHCFGIGVIVKSNSSQHIEGEIVFGNTSVAQY
jgi:NADPH-dependent curcumin reductase CurA